MARKHGGEAEIGTRDAHHNLISVLYRALQGAETCGQYVRDVEPSGDTELLHFLRECREEEMMRAQRAKLLLVERLTDIGEELEEGEEAVTAEDEEAAEGAPI